MAAQMGRLLEKATYEVPVDLDWLIQFLPPEVRKKILADTVAAKIQQKRTLPWVIAHRKGWAAIHDEFWVKIIIKLESDFDDEEESIQRAHEIAFEALMDAEPWDEEAPNEIFRKVLEEELGYALLEIPNSGKQ